MKTLERLVLEQLWPMVKPTSGPSPVSYQPQLGVKDAVKMLSPSC